MSMLALFRHRAPRYNYPPHLAMFVSQWAHHWYLAGVMSYEQYNQLQNAAYDLFGPWPPRNPTTMTYRPTHGGYPG